MLWHMIRLATIRKHHGSYNTRSRDPARELQLFQHTHPSWMFQHPPTSATRLSVSPLTIRANSRTSYQVIGLVVERLDRFSPRLPLDGELSTIPNCCLQFDDDHTSCHLNQHLARSWWWVLRVRSYGPEDSTWNLLAYSGLREFSIREESSSKETWLGWMQPGEVYQM